MKHTLLIITALMLVFGCSNDGVITEYYENGQKRSEVTYKDGKEDGKWTRWHENGQKSGEGTYKSYENKYQLSELDGLYTNWYENGQKRREETYKDGELISEKYWNEDGSVKE